MKIKKIRRIIREQLSGKSSGNSLLAVSTGFPVFQQYMQDAMQAGRETDADAIVIFIIWGNTSSRVTSRHFKLSNWSLLNTDGPEWLFSMHHESLLTVPCSHFEVQKLLKVQS